VPVVPGYAAISVVVRDQDPRELRKVDASDEVDLAADRAARQLALAADPDRGGRVYGATLQEAHVILALEETGQLRGPFSRAAGRGDCTDANGQDWDVKRFRDDMRRPRFDVGVALEDIRLEVRCGENVIVDLTGLADRANRDALREAVDRADLAENVRWYE
jgi:hypothetical protein